VFIQFYIADTHPGKSAKGFRLLYSAGICPRARGETCHNQGYCFNNTCHCSPGFTGPDCSQSRCDNNCGKDKDYGRCENNVCKCKEGYYGGDCLDPFCDRMNFMKASSGMIKDHHKELNSNRDGYRHNTNCSWYIQSDSSTPSEHITLTIEALDIEPDFDFLVIYEGSFPDPSKMLRNLTGKNIPPRITTVSPSMLVTFTSDEGVSNVGFVASYTIKGATISASMGTVVLIAVIFFLLGMGSGVGGYLGWKKWQQKRNEIEYSKVPLQAEDLADLSEEES